MHNQLPLAYYAPITSGQNFKAEFKNDLCHVASDKEEILVTGAIFNGKTLQLSIKQLTPHAHAGELILVTAEYFFGHLTELSKISFHVTPSLTDYWAHHFTTHPGELVFCREEFYQLPQLWHFKKEYTITPERWSETNGRSHPVRASFPQGDLYRRYVPQLGKTVSLRLANPQTDLEIFHQWHHQSRVSHFWELTLSKEEHKSYLEKGLKDPHQTPMIVSLDQEPIGYYEMYWVTEDRLGPYYEADAYDRGFHFLIGNDKYLGFQTTDFVIKSCLHFLFLEDPRTRKLMVEPRHDNQKVLRYADASIGWKRIKEFDFPHKRAVLLECRREVFFNGHAV